MLAISLHIPYQSLLLCRSWNMYSISNYDYNSSILAVPLGYIWLPKSVLLFWGIFSWRYPSQILPWVLVYRTLYIVLVAMRQFLKCSTAHQSDDLEGILRFILACLKKTPCASSGQALKAKYKGYPTSMLPWNKELFSGVSL